MTRERPLGVAVVGLGVGEQHARSFNRNPHCVVRSLCDLSESRARALADELGAGVAVDFQSVLQDDSIDIVSLATFDDAHFEQVLAAVESGRHVFVEKPLCRTLEEAQAVKRALQAHPGVKLHCNLVLRSAPLYQWLATAVRSGALGEIYSFDGQYLYGRIEKLTEGWRGKISGYSVMQGGGIHLIDLMLWILADRPEAVFASGTSIATQHTTFRGNDHVTALVEFKSGVIAGLTANFGCVHRHQHVVRVFGTKASFLYDDAGARIHRSRDPGEAAVRLLEDPLPPSKGVLVEDFVSAILSNGATNVQTVLDGICVSIACDRSAVSGRRERVEYV